MSACEDLATAKAKLKQLLTGTNVVSVSYTSPDGGQRTVQYRNYATDVDKLKLLIAQLETECGEQPANQRRKPFRIVW